MAESFGGIWGHVIYPWHSEGMQEAGPSVSELLQEAPKLFPGATLDKIHVHVERCCPGSDTCGRINIGLSHESDWWRANLSGDPGE